MSDLAQLRRWQADEYEKKNQPRLGELNIPQILRDDANEIERLQANVDQQLDVNEILADKLAKLQAVVDAHHTDYVSASGVCPVCQTVLEDE